MKLSGHDLKQINEETLGKLAPDQLLSFTVRLLDDFNEAMDRLNQNSNNSSRPPSSAAPWDSKKSDDQSGQNDNDNDLIDADRGPEEQKGASTETASSASEVDEPATDLATNNQELRTPEDANTSVEPMPITPVKRTAGKQKGAQGYGRTQKLPITETIYHIPCSNPLRVVQYWFGRLCDI